MDILTLVNISLISKFQLVLICPVEVPEAAEFGLYFTTGASIRWGVACGGVTHLFVVSLVQFLRVRKAGKSIDGFRLTGLSVSGSANEPAEMRPTRTAHRSAAVTRTVQSDTHRELCLRSQRKLLLLPVSWKRSALMRCGMVESERDGPEQSALM